VLLLLVLVVLLLLGLMIAGILVFHLDRQQINVVGFAFAIIVTLLLLVFGYPWRAQKNFEVVARGLGFSFAPAMPAQLHTAVTVLPLVGNNQSANCLWGSLHGTPVLMMDLNRRAVGGRTTETVVIFLEPVPDLPDFGLEPTADRSHFWNIDLFQMLGLRRSLPLPPGRFGERYRLDKGSFEELVNWLTEPFQNELARQPGWCVQSGQGMLLFYRKLRIYPAAGRPTLLALAGQLRQLMFIAHPVPENV
jgi:hypothetical protein